MARVNNMEKATDEYIKALYFIHLYRSDACVKENPRDVKQLSKTIIINDGKVQHY